MCIVVRLPSPLLGSMASFRPHDGDDTTPSGGEGSLFPNGIGCLLYVQQSEASGLPVTPVLA